MGSGGHDNNWDRDDRYSGPSKDPWEVYSSEYLYAQAAKAELREAQEKLKKETQTKALKAKRIKELEKELKDLQEDK